MKFCLSSFSRFFFTLKGLVIITSLFYVWFFNTENDYSMYLCRFFKLYICLISCTSSCISCHHCGDYNCQVDKWKYSNAQIDAQCNRHDILLETLHYCPCSCHCIHLPLQWYAMLIYLGTEFLYPVLVKIDD